MMAPQAEISYTRFPSHMPFDSVEDDFAGVCHMHGGNFIHRNKFPEKTFFPSLPPRKAPHEIVFLWQNSSGEKKFKTDGRTEDVRRMAMDNVGIDIQKSFQ